MDKLIQHMAGAFSSMGAILTFIAIMVILFLYSFKETLNDKLKNFTFFNRPKKRKVAEAKYHDLFNEVEQVRNKINHIEYTTHSNYDEAKTVLIRRLINIQLDITATNLNKFLALKDIDKMENQHLKYELIRALRETNEEYNQKAYLEFVELGVSSEDAKFLLEEYAKFRDDVFEGFTERIESITANSVYNTNFHRISSAFEVIALGLYLIARDSKYTCSLINGRYLKYSDKIKL